MVLYFTSTAVEPPATIYVGKDKFENEELLRYGLERDVWFHVDKLSSAHVYLRLPPNIESWETIPEALVNDCSQLVKANSIEGNKKANITIIYTPWSNIKKTGDMAVGAVTFFNDRKVKRFHIKEKDNAIVNRLNKTKKEVQVDHEAERQERLRDEGRVKKAKAIEDVSFGSHPSFSVLRSAARAASLITMLTLLNAPLLKLQKKAQQAEQKRRKEEAEARDYSKRECHQPAMTCSCQRPDASDLPRYQFQYTPPRPWKRRDDVRKNAGSPNSTAMRPAAATTTKTMAWTATTRSCNIIAGLPFPALGQNDSGTRVKISTVRKRRAALEIDSSGDTTVQNIQKRSKREQEREEQSRSERGVVAGEDQGRGLEDVLPIGSRGAGHVKMPTPLPRPSFCLAP